jgi:hypothetical protein
MAVGFHCIAAFEAKNLTGSKGSPAAGCFEKPQVLIQPSPARQAKTSQIYSCYPKQATNAIREFYGGLIRYAGSTSR